MPHYAGRPGLSAKRAHDCTFGDLYVALASCSDHLIDIPSRFNASLAGLPGNDDSGAMASFTLFSTIGLFPNPGQNVYLIIPPFFESVSIVSPATNKTSTIQNVNFDAGYQNIYIQSAKVNGEEYTKNWIGHEFFTEGWTLELVLGSEESSWGTRVQDRPPSLSDTTGSMGYMN
jgi:putative alpha-1,2-mannosidase